MGWSGGTYTRVHNFSADASAGIQAQASRFDAEFDETKAGLENCVTRDGQNAASGDLPMGGNKHTGVGAATSAGEYLRADQNTQQVGIYVTGEISGHSFSASADVFPGALSDGMRICVHASSNFVGGSATASAVQFIVNGLSAPVVDQRGQYPLGQTIIPSGRTRDFVYNSADTAWQAMSPVVVSGSVNATIIAYNDDSTAYFATTTAPIRLNRSGNIVLWTLHEKVAISASISVESFIIRGIPAWALQRIYGTVTPYMKGGHAGLVISSSSTDVGMYFSRESTTDVGLTPYTSIASGPGYILQPFVQSFVVD